jgi:predicted Zn-dependent protease
VTELNAAVYSWTLGYTRVNLELARTLLALKRPQEAIAALRPALHGSLDGSSLYVSRTEIQESMARAFDDAGQRDSARVYYERVANAWSHADPRFHERRQFASMRAKALTSNGIEPSPRRGRNAN